MNMSKKERKNRMGKERSETHNAFFVLIDFGCKIKEDFFELPRIESHQHVYIVQRSCVEK